MTTPVRFRFSLEYLGIGARPRVERAEARDPQPIEDAAREAARQEAIAQATAVEDEWAQVERFVQEHMPCADLHLREVYVWNADDRSLVDRVDVALYCRAHSLQFVREVVPEAPARTSEMLEPVARLRADLAEVERTGWRPGRVQVALTVAWRLVDAEDFRHEHRVCGGRFEVGEGVPTLAGLTLGAPRDPTDRVWIRCVGCGRPSTWQTEGPDEAAALLAELRAVAG